MTLFIHRASARLLDGRGRHFDPYTRRWVGEGGLPDEAVPSAPADAVRWLQRESGQPVRVPVGVIGTRLPSTIQARSACTMGRLLAGHGLVLLCGGRGGVMEEACQGAAAAGGFSVGLLPDDEPEAANPYVSVPIATGIGVARNALIARAACCLVAIGGGHGTLSEIAFALQFGRPVFGLNDAPAVTGMISCPSPEAAFQAVLRSILRLS